MVICDTWFIYIYAYWNSLKLVQTGSNWTKLVLRSLLDIWLIIYSIDVTEIWLTDVCCWYKKTVVSPTFHLQSLSMPPKSNANSANSEETGARPKTTPRMPAKMVAVVRPGIQIKQEHLVPDGCGRGHRLFYSIGYVISFLYVWIYFKSWFYKFLHLFL